MKSFLFIQLFMGLLLLCGCATMTFTQQTERPVSDEKIQHWHHTIINGIVEVSEPANLYTDCRGKPWQSAQVEFRFKNVLAGGFANVVAESVISTSGLIAFYSPWNVEIQCTK
ncbi:hypothetical protein [Bacterioplanoides sp.]|uniref:hypothetical protein n=1 Tax=Bacterioplanoides sp. TaxID=2066072 RepID=UPI003B00A350